MPRPKNKSELKKLSIKNYELLIALLKTYTSDKLYGEFPKKYMNRNVRDVLAHLHHWHLMFLEWYEVGMNQKIPEMPAKGYTWKMTPELNRFIQRHYSEIDLDVVQNLLDQSHNNVLSIIDKHSNHDLFEKRKYAWTGSTSLGAYLISATSSHYDWAYKLIKRCLA